MSTDDSNVVNEESITTTSSECENSNDVKHESNENQSNDTESNSISSENMHNGDNSTINENHSKANEESNITSSINENTIENETEQNDEKLNEKEEITHSDDINIDLENNKSESNISEDNQTEENNSNSINEEKEIKIEKNDEKFDSSDDKGINTTEIITENSKEITLSLEKQEEREEEEKEEKTTETNENTPELHETEEKDKKKIKPKEVILPSPVHDEYTADQIDDMIYNIIKSNDENEKKIILTELVRISPTAIGKEVLSSKMKELVEILQSKVPIIQKLSLQIINIVGTSDIAKVRFRKAGGFSVLVKLFSAEFEIQSLALNTIGYLITREVENARELMQVEGIPPLINFLSHENSRIKFFAAACSWVLAAYQDEFQNVLLEAGAVSKLLNLINSNHEDISWQAAGALRNIVLKNPKVHQAIIDAKGIEKYKTVLERKDCSNRVIGLIIQTFVIISSSDIIKDEINTVGLFPCLFYHLQKESTSIEFKSRILYTLTNICTKHQQNQNQLYNNGGIDILFNILSNESIPEELRSDTATVLWAASINNENTVKYLCNDKNFKFLQMALVMEPEKVLVGIVATITNIASFPDTREKLSEKGIIPLILDFLRGSYTPLLETTAGAVMALIRNNEGNINQLMEWDGPLLLARNIISTNVGVKQNVLGALRILLVNQFVKTLKAIRDVDAIKPMLLILKDSSEPKLQLNSASCLCSIAESNAKARDDMIQLQAQHAIKIGLQGPSPNLRSVVCDLTQYLAKYSNEFRASLSRNDVLYMIIDLINTKDIDPILLEKAIKALWAINIGNASHQQIVKDKGCIKVLLDLLMEEEGRIRTKAAVLKALAAICSNNYKTQEEVRTYNGAIDKIIESLSVGDGVTELGEKASLLVWCLCLGNNRMKNTFRISNGLIPLIELLANNLTNNAIVINTIGAIITLSKKSNNNRQIFKEAGIINIIKSLDNEDNDYINNQLKEILTLYGAN